jgi:hypothetical protein
MYDVKRHGVGMMNIGDDQAAYQEVWLYHWHRLIDHLAEGKDAESFFADLLK